MESTTTREELHRLIEALPAERLIAARAALEPLTDPVLRALLEAPRDDEPVTLEQAAALDRARAAAEAGLTVSDEELGRRLRA